MKNNSDTPFPVSLKIRIDWSEMDLFGHVNNVTFAKYIQAARVCYTEQAGIMDMLKNHQIGFMLASSALQFRKPLYYPGEITVSGRLEFMKTTSFGLYFCIFDNTGQLAAEAHDVLVLFDFAKHIKVAIPGDIRLKVELMENQ